jgi:hypothetical protein
VHNVYRIVGAAFGLVVAAISLAICFLIIFGGNIFGGNLWGGNFFLAGIDHW